MLLTVRESDNTRICYGAKLTLQAFGASRRTTLFADLTFQRDLTSLVDEFARGGGRLLSLDVFDTVLLRNEKSEIRRFYEMAGRFVARACTDQGSCCEAKGVLVARLLCADIAYRFGTSVAGCREGELEEIHLGMVRALGLPEALAAEFTRIELDYEVENLEPNPAIVPMLGAARDAGLDVVLISDMYMGSRHILKLLDAHFPGTFGSAQVYSSGDLKVSKRSGLLFDHVASCRKVAPQQALHVGDNLESDYKRARGAGWQALYWPHSEKEHAAIERDEKAMVDELLRAGVDVRRLTV